MHLKTNQSKYLYEIDPYKENGNMVKIKFRAEEYEYYKTRAQIKVSKCAKNDPIGLIEGLIFNL